MIDLKRDIDHKLHVKEDSISVNMLERAQCLWNYPDVSVFQGNLNSNQFIGDPKIKQLVDKRLKPISFFDYRREQANEHNNRNSQLDLDEDDQLLSPPHGHFDDDYEASRLPNHRDEQELFPIEEVKEDDYSFDPGMF